LDEIFGKKLVDFNGGERTTKVYRKTRLTTMADARDESKKSLNNNDYKEV